MNIAMLLQHARDQFPDAPAVSRGPIQDASYRELARRASAIGRGLREVYELNTGDTVALAMKNCPEYFVVLFGIWYAGLVAVPMNAKLHPTELQYILAHSRARVCFVTSDLEDSMRSQSDNLDDLDAIVCVTDETYRTLSEGSLMDPQWVSPGAPAWLFYTSGTTGRPKGATLTHRNLYAMTFAYYSDIDAVRSDDTMIHPAPLSHGSGLYALSHIAKGANNVVPEKGFDPEEIVALVAKYSGVSFFAAPTMVTTLLNDAASRALDATHLKTVIYGGGPMYVSHLRDALARWGPQFSHIYGQGESPMTITALHKSWHGAVDHPLYDELLASTGFARTGVAVRVVNEAGETLPPGQVGEVTVRGDVVMAGYWENEVASRAALRDGWLHTGDMGAFHEQGFLTLKDRVKDLIISGGSNIYPREVEEVLLRHRDVLEVSVIGRPHQDWGEEVVAVVVARAGAALDRDSLDALCLENMARFKRPRAYYFYENLPKNNYGKVLKTALRASIEVE